MGVMTPPDADQRQDGQDRDDHTDDVKNTVHLRQTPALLTRIAAYAAKNSTVWKRFRCELIARQTSGSTKNVAADELGWFAVEVAK
jgi:hypothetical protein